MPNPFNMRSVPEAPVPMVPNNLGLDPNNPQQMAGMMLAYLQDVYHGMGLQSRTINSLRTALENISTDDIDIEHDPTGRGSYWSIPDRGNVAAENPPPNPEESGSGVSYFYARIEWDTVSAYDWAEVIWDASEDDGTFVDLSGGRQTAGITGGTGTGTQSKAYEESGLADLPDGLVVRMEVVTDDAGGLQPLFRLVQNAQASPTALGAADATDVSADLGTWGIVGAADIGCNFIIQARTSYNSTSHKLIAHFRTIGLSGNGVALSASAETTQDILTFDQITVVTQLQVTASSVQYKDRTAYVVDAGTESAWTNLSSTVCP